MENNKSVWQEEFHTTDTKQEKFQFCEESAEQIDVGENQVI